MLSQSVSYSYLCTVMTRYNSHTVHLTVNTTQSSVIHDHVAGCVLHAIKLMARLERGELSPDLDGRVLE